MCELFGLSASQARRGVDLPLAAFRRRGGEVADNPDGWGIAWWEDGRFRLAKEPLPACRDERYPEAVASLKTVLLVAHVRKARLPPINTRNNTHPFLRECCGRAWAFAHNGLVPEVVELETANQARVCRPEGETDSEFAFCHLLSHVTRHLHAAVPENDWLDRLGELSGEIARFGKFNFLLADGEHLIAYGLHALETRDEHGAPFALVATEALDADVAWKAFAPGELRIYRAGTRVKRVATAFR
jgi:predicted glutamine amidotransferase